MADISGLISLIIWVGVIIAIVNKVKRKKSQLGAKAFGGAAKAVIRQQNNGIEWGKIAKRSVASADVTDRLPLSPQYGGEGKKKVKKSLNIASVMEDRNHDWLAKQLAEERVALFKTSAMFDLKMSHAAKCDAKELRDSHAKNCDAGGVDNAQA